MKDVSHDWQITLDAGQPLIIGAGDYECPVLSIPSGATITGAGRLATRIRVDRWIASGTIELADFTLHDPTRPPRPPVLHNGEPWSMMLVADDLLDAVIRNVRLCDGGAILWRPLRCKIFDSWFERTRQGAGLYMRNAWGCDIRGNHFLEAAGDPDIAIGLGLHDSTACSVSDNHSIGNAGYGYDLSNSQMLTIVGNHATKNALQGFAFDQMDAGSADDCVVEGNMATSNGDVGFWFGATIKPGKSGPRKTSRLSVTHNRAVGNERLGFEIDRKAFDHTCVWEDNQIP